MSRTDNPENMTEFGKKVCMRLREVNMTQKELANHIYLNNVYLNRIFYGKSPVQMRIIVSIAKELNMDAVELAGAALYGTK